MQGYKVYFVGSEGDYNAFGKHLSTFYPCPTAVEAAALIKGASLYIGTQTVHTWIAEAAGVDRIVAASTQFKDTTLRVVKGFKGSFYTPASLGQ